MRDICSKLAEIYKDNDVLLVYFKQLEEWLQKTI